MYTLAPKTLKTQKPVMHNLSEKVIWKVDLPKRKQKRKSLENENQAWKWTLSISNQVVTKAMMHDPGNRNHGDEEVRDISLLLTHGCHRWCKCSHGNSSVFIHNIFSSWIPHTLLLRHPREFRAWGRETSWTRVVSTSLSHCKFSNIHQHSQQ